jgi:hypothetical protein
MKKYFMFKLSFKKALLLIAVGTLLLAPAVMAAGLLPDSENGTGKAAEAVCKNITSGNCGNYSLTDMMTVFVKISNWILGVVGAVVLLFFVYGGFRLILSGGSEENVKKGKQILIGAVIGLCIVFSSFLIIKFATTLIGVDSSYTKDDSLQVTIPK